jgi:predicted Fe-S protein YdhL (DUF1289 family)
MSGKIHNAVIERLDLQGDATSLPSPCISVCTMDAQAGWCAGCFRTLDEIVDWGSADEQHKRAIWQEVKRRYQSIPDN